MRTITATTFLVALLAISGNVHALQKSSSKDNVALSTNGADDTGLDVPAFTNPATTDVKDPATTDGDGSPVLADAVASVNSDPSRDNVKGDSNPGSSSESSHLSTHTSAPSSSSDVAPLNDEDGSTDGLDSTDDDAATDDPTNDSTTATDDDTIRTTEDGTGMNSADTWTADDAPSSYRGDPMAWSLSPATMMSIPKTTPVGAVLPATVTPVTTTVPHPTPSDPSSFASPSSFNSAYGLKVTSRERLAIGLLVGIIAILL